MTTSTLELVQFQLLDGKTDADVATTHEGVSSFLTEQPGFLYRSVSQREDGTYIDIVYWDSLINAKTAGDAFMQDARGQALIACCNMDSVSIQYLPVLSESMSASCEEMA